MITQHRFMTALFMDTGEVKAFREGEKWQEAQDLADDWVWQFAPDQETAIAQHDDKIDAWQANPTLVTY